MSVGSACCGNCKHFSPDRKHKSTGGCAIHKRMVMRFGGCQKHDFKTPAK